MKRVVIGVGVAAALFVGAAFGRFGELARDDGTAAPTNDRSPVAPESRTRATSPIARARFVDSEPENRAVSRSTEVALKDRITAMTEAQLLAALPALIATEEGRVAVLAVLEAQWKTSQPPRKALLIHLLLAHSGDATRSTVDELLSIGGRLTDGAPNRHPVGTQMGVSIWGEIDRDVGRSAAGVLTSDQTSRVVEALSAVALNSLSDASAETVAVAMMGGGQDRFVAELSALAADSIRAPRVRETAMVALGQKLTVADFVNAVGFDVARAPTNADEVQLARGALTGLHNVLNHDPQHGQVERICRSVIADWPDGEFTLDVKRSALRLLGGYGSKAAAADVERIITATSDPGLKAAAERALEKIKARP
jgi:hypothetical protein